MPALLCSACLSHPPQEKFPWLMARAHSRCPGTCGLWLGICCRDKPSKVWLLPVPPGPSGPLSDRSSGIANCPPILCFWSWLSSGWRLHVRGPGLGPWQGAPDRTPPPYSLFQEGSPGLEGQNPGMSHPRPADSPFPCLWGFPSSSPWDAHITSLHGCLGPKGMAKARSVARKH